VFPACGRRVHCRGTKGLSVRSIGSSEMADQVFFVVLKSSKHIIRHVLAARYEVRGEHLAFINTEGRLQALFLIDSIQSWNLLSQ
jgi:hypothetical protein